MYKIPPLCRWGLSVLALHTHSRYQVDSLTGYGAHFTLMLRVADDAERPEPPSGGQVCGPPAHRIIDVFGSPAQEDKLRQGHDRTWRGHRLSLHRL